MHAVMITCHEPLTEVVEHAGNGVDVIVIVVTSTSWRRCPSDMEAIDSQSKKKTLDWLNSHPY